MANQKNSQIAAKHYSWCSEAGLDTNRAFVLYFVPAYTDTSDIEEAVYSVKIFGRVKVRDIQSDTQTGSKLVLCECDQEVDCITPYLQPLNRGSALKIFLITDGKTVNNIHALLSTDVPQGNSPESII